MSRLLDALNASPFRSPKTWSMALVACDDAGGLTVTSRAGFAAYLRANDLQTLAHEGVTRRVAAGHVLTYFNIEGENASIVRFIVARVTR
jgi:hypothetical protein